jgi:hypothetical protein
MTIQIVQRQKYFNLYYITPTPVIDTGSNQFMLLNKVDEKVIINLSLPYINHAFYPSFLSHKWQKFVVDMPMLTVCCNFNSSGEKTYEQIRQYALGYANRNFKLANRTIVNAHIDDQDVEIHTLLSMLTM